MIFLIHTSKSLGMSEVFALQWVLLHFLFKIFHLKWFGTQEITLSVFPCTKCVSSKQMLLIDIANTSIPLIQETRKFADIFFFDRSQDYPQLFPSWFICRTSNPFCNRVPIKWIRLSLFSRYPLFNPTLICRRLPLKNAWKLPQNWQKLLRATLNGLQTT